MGAFQNPKNAGMENLVVLTTEERDEAIKIGRTRHQQNREIDTEQMRGAGGRDQNHLDDLGACGERAVAKYFDIPWDGNLGDWTAADVGDYEVRTRSSHSYDLPLYKELKDLNKGNAPFILATCQDRGENLYFHIRGWIYGYEAMRDKFWRLPEGDTWTGGHCWLVRADELWPMDQFPKEEG